MCQKIGCLVSNLLYFAEKLAVWIAGLSLVGCIILTLIMMLGLGIGLGYNYCYVDYQSRARYRYVPPHYATIPRSLIRYGSNTTTPSSLLRAQSENVTSSTSTKAILEKDKLSANNPPQVLKYYKFWAVPESANFESVINTKEKVEDKNLTNMTTDKNPEKTNGTNKTTINVTTYKKIVHADRYPANDSNPSGSTSQNNKPISINGLDLMALLSQLRAENRNYSLQILTT